MAPLPGSLINSMPAGNSTPTRESTSFARKVFRRSKISGFSAPIGGYSIDGPAERPFLTAVPLWRPLLENNKTVATATWPGGDALNVTVPGLNPSPIVQPAEERTVTYTVPFGAATAPFQKGFSLTAANFSPAPPATVADLITAGHTSFSPVL